MLIRREHPKLYGPYRLLPVGDRHWAIVDADDYDRLIKYYWKLQKAHHCYYAVRKVRRNGRYIYVKMHREIMHTPKGMDCHHVNHITLDNRKENLQNLTPEEHRSII